MQVGMKNTRSSILIPAFILFTVLTSVCRANTTEIPKWVDLFNGKDLSGWVDVNTSPETWRVKDGMLICKGKLSLTYEHAVLDAPSFR